MGRPRMYESQIRLNLTAELARRVARLREKRRRRLGVEPTLSDIVRESTAVGLAELERIEDRMPAPFEPDDAEPEPAPVVRPARPAPSQPKPAAAPPPQVCEVAEPVGDDAEPSGPPPPDAAPAVDAEPVQTTKHPLRRTDDPAPPADSDASAIHQLRDKGWKPKDIAKALGLKSPSSLSNVTSGRSTRLMPKSSARLHELAAREVPPADPDPVKVPAEDRAAAGEPS